MRRREFLWTSAMGSSAFLVAGLRPSSAHAGETLAPSQCTGVYRYSGGEKQLAALAAAVEAATADVAAILRPIARKRLNESQKPGGDLVIRGDGRRISIATTGKPTIAGTVGGPSFKWKNRYGDRLDLTLTMKASTLRIQFKNRTGKTVTRMTFGEHGRLTVRTTIRDDRLPKPLSYRLSYRQR